MNGIITGPAVCYTFRSWPDEFYHAIAEDRFPYFKKLMTRLSHTWRTIKMPSGNNLIQETIAQNRYHFFDYLLRISDVEYLENFNNEGDTAIGVAMKMENPKQLCYVPDLVRKYTTFPEHYNNHLMHWLIKMGSFTSVHFLLKRGMDPNAYNPEYKGTALHVAIILFRYYKIICMLLWYGVDPHIKYLTFHTFEVAVLSRHESDVLELLFDYTFDNLETYLVNFTVLLELAKKRSPLFHRIIEYDVEFFVEEVKVKDVEPTHKLMFQVDNDFFEIIVQRFKPQLAECLKDFRIFAYMTNEFMEKLHMLIDSGPILCAIILDAFNAVAGWNIFLNAVNQGESEATELVIFMAMYGICIPKRLFDLVYSRYGYCELFDFLLHIDYEPNDLLINENLMVSLIRDIHKDINCHFFAPQVYSAENLLDVLDFFAGRKLKQFLVGKIIREELWFTDREFERLRDHPDIPRLVESARNVFRQHLIRRYKVQSTRRFYDLVKNLNINSSYKNIILLKTKIY